MYWGIIVQLSSFLAFVLKTFSFTAQKLKFSIRDFFSKFDQIRKKLQIWSHLLKKSLKTSFFVQFFFDLLGNFSIYLCLAMEKWLSICDTFIWETLNTLCTLQQKPCHSIKNNRKIYVKYFKVEFYSSQTNFENLVLHPSVEACLKRNISIKFFNL